jgi:AcrR family transcriptional regulator
MVADGVDERLIQAALAAANEQRWRRLSMADIASRAEVSLVDAYRVFPSKAALLLAMLSSTDVSVLTDGPADKSESVRDRLFDVLMRHFDALHARRPGIAAIIRDLVYEPPTLISLLPRFATSIAWMLETAGLSTAGLLGTVRIKALSVVYLSTLRIWIDDDTPDMARTMAALDKALRRLEQLARSVPGQGGRFGPADAEYPSSTDDTPPDSPSDSPPTAA